MADQVFLGTVWTNTDNDPVVVGDVLIRDLTVNNGAKRTTTVASTVGVGIALTAADPGQQTQVATIIGQRVNARILLGAVVARGDRLVTDSTEGLVRVDNAASLAAVLMIATSAKSAGIGTTTEGIIVAGALGAGGAGGADPAASFVTAVAEGGLANERVLTTTATVAVTDGGAGSTITLDIPNNAVTDAILRNSAGFSVIGKGTTGTGDPGDIIADLQDKALFRGPSAVAFDFIRKLVKSLELSGVLTPAAIGANQNDYNPATLVDASQLRLAPSAAYNITGIGDSGSPGHGAGRVLVIQNISANLLTLKNQDAGSAAANRFLFASGDLALATDDSVVLVYDATTARWRRADSAGSGGGGGAPTNASYVTTASEGGLSNERVLTAGSAISVTDGGPGTTVTIAVPDNAISNAKLRDSTGFSVIGKSATGTGDPADIVSDAEDKVLFRGPSTVGFDYVRKLVKDLSLTGIIAPTTISADQDDYSPTGLADASTLLLTASDPGPFRITGIAGGSPGRLLLLHNIGNDAEDNGFIVLSPFDGGSAAANQFAISGDVVLGFNESALLQYTPADGGFDAFWRVIDVVADGSVTNERIRQSSAVSVIGRYLNSAGAVADISASSTQNGNVLQRRANELIFWALTDVNENLNLAGVLTPSSLSADQNDYNPTNLDTSSSIRQAATLAVKITGLQGGVSGRILIVQNISAFDITLTNEDAASSAANRFSLNIDLVISPNAGVLVQYDGTTSRWRAVEPRVPLIDNQFFADQLDIPDNADWTINATASTVTKGGTDDDVKVAAFDDTTEEGRGLPIFIPLGATRVRFEYWLAAAAAPGATNNKVQLRVYRKEYQDNTAPTAWSSAVDFTLQSLANNVNLQKFSDTFTLAALSLVVGRGYNLEFTRKSGLTNKLVGDMHLWLLRVTVF